MYINDLITYNDLSFFGNGAQPRPIEYFFQDVQDTIDKELIDLHILLLSARKWIYVDNSGPDDKMRREMLQNYAITRYKRRIQNVFYLFDCCRTLNDAEKQQKAFERQLSINGKEPCSILSDEVPESFFEKLYDIKLRHEFYTLNLSREECIRGYQVLYDRCRKQPIPAVMLPLVLTIFSTDGKLFSNLYAYFKYKNRRLSNDAQKHVFLLFEEISKMVADQFKGKYFEIPVFHWTELEDTFCQYRNLPSADIEIVKRYFCEYRSRNDLSKQEEAKLTELSYGNDIRSLAKLCNLNAYIAMKYSIAGTIPGKVKKPLQQLQAGNLLPVANNYCDQDSFDRYFDGLYKLIPCNPDFSYFALLRYYRLPLDLLLSAEPDFFSDIEEAVVVAVTQYREELKHKYWQDQQIFNFYDGKEYEWLNGRIETRIQYRLQNTPRRNKYVKHAKVFASQIVEKFTKDDYRKFIEQIKNFHVNYFPMFLRDFCETHDISGHDDVSDQEKCFFEDEAYVTVLDLVQNQLLENVAEFWQNAIAKELYI